MTVNTQELRELLEKATPGPWKVVTREVMEDASVYPTHIVGGAAEFQVCLMESPSLAKLAMDDPNGWPASGKAREANTAYIATANPLAVSALLDELDALRAELQVRQWISVDERLPDSEEIVLVMSPGSQYQKVNFDCWRMQREAPLSWSSATIETGMGWDEHEFEEITHWMPLPPAPPQGDGA